jgi:hypothetical protein
MARGLFTLKQQLQGLQQKAWNTGLGVLPLSSYLGSFNGSSQYLSVASTTALGLGTGNFTIECWVNPSIVSATSSDYTFVFDMRNGSNDAPCLTIQEGVFRFQTDLVASVALSPTISPWTWYHIAYVRNGNSSILSLLTISLQSDNIVIICQLSSGGSDANIGIFDPPWWQPKLI